MNKPYLPADAKTKADLNNDKTTTDHNIDDDAFYGGVSDELQGNYLEIFFTVPTGTPAPKLEDICGIHITNQGGIIVTEKTNIKGLDIDQLYEFVDDLIKNLSFNSYVIEIEKTNNGAVVKSKVAACGIHDLQAITHAFNHFLLDTHEEYVTEGLVEHCLMAGENIVIEIEDGVTATLLSVSKDAVFSGHYIASTYEILERIDIWSGLNKGISEPTRSILQTNDLNTCYLMDVKDDNLNPSNVIGIRIEGGLGELVAERVGLSGMDAEQLDAIVYDLVSSLEEKSYTVSIKSVKNNLDARCRVPVKALHKTQGAERAMVFLLQNTYNKAQLHTIEGGIVDTVKKSIKNRQPIVVTTDDVAYTAISIKENKRSPTAAAAATTSLLHD